ncbi:isochorismatase family protein [Nocardia flavorosea]|uniref:Isochorismatase family protein n=1 Tax=Nocardia flavorosea TaxID=53429 RepID=A0A846YHV1_9NOCA|nr:isochorismatase family protein [Nocardia flavorosea]NKY57270.1 isochorismatase family protein [Nocardia flavorosea]
MPMQPIAPYAMPPLDEEIANQVSWGIEPDRCALLIHDMQNYFLTAYQLDRDPARTMIDNISRLRDRCHELGIPVIYSMQPGDQHPDRRGLLADFWGAGMPDGRDTEVIAELEPDENDIQVTKWRYSAFQRTDLRQLLGYRNRDQLIVTGVYAHMGCMLSAAEAFMNDIRAFMVHDAVADFSRDAHRIALQYTARRCGMVLNTDAVLAQLGAPVPAGA